MFIPARAGMYELSTDTLAALQLRYPLANVEREMLLYGLWLMKNPASRPKLPLRGCENWLKKASPKAAMVDLKVAKWWETHEGILTMGKRVGIEPSPRDTWAELKAKIAERLKGRAA